MIPASLTEFGSSVRDVIVERGGNLILSTSGPKYSYALRKLIMEPFSKLTISEKIISGVLETDLTIFVEEDLKIADEVTVFHEYELDVTLMSFASITLNGKLKTHINLRAVAVNDIEIGNLDITGDLNCGGTLILNSTTIDSNQFIPTRNHHNSTGKWRVSSTGRDNFLFLLFLGFGIGLIAVCIILPIIALGYYVIRMKIHQSRYGDETESLLKSTNSFTLKRLSKNSSNSAKNCQICSQPFDNERKKKMCQNCHTVYCSLEVEYKITSNGKILGYCEKCYQSLSVV